MSSPFALDTNILVYLYDSNSSSKRAISESLVEQGPLISAQVVSEYLNVTKRLLKLPKESTFARCRQVFDLCSIVPITNKHIHLAAELISQYDLQIFDSIIVASLLDTQCTVLYSEDMQHGLWIKGKIRIVNPFV
ncbi:PIN domain-containing protein [Dyadobacter sandarakinus]